MVKAAIRVASLDQSGFAGLNCRPTINTARVTRIAVIPLTSLPSGEHPVTRLMSKGPQRWVLWEVPAERRDDSGHDYGFGHGD